MFAASKTDSISTASAYEISRSLRFNAADSAYLTRTPASSSNRKTWTWSAWVKINAIPTGFAEWQSLFSAGIYETATPSVTIEIVSGNLRIAFFGSGGYAGYSFTANQTRDLSAWYHLVFVVDTTQTISDNRIKIYINNLLATSSAYSPPALNYDTGVNLNQTHNIGAFTYYTGTGYQSFARTYMTEVNFIDGQALTPSSFGETNIQTGVWQPKAYSGSYGTNGFYLNFSDNSNITAATLGKDYSGNGNNWTPNNFSVSAGAGNDSMVDVPTPYGIDTGAGGTIRGNYCTLNPLDTISTVTLANGNLDYTGSSGLSIATFGFSSGKWYWEHKIGAVDYCVIGIYQSGSKSMGYLGQTGVSIGITNGGSPQYAGVSAPTGTLAAFTSADTIGFALDLDAGTFTVYRNNVSSLVFSGLTETWFPAQGMNYSASGIFNFGQRPFAYTAPSGFKALCTQNLPTPTIGATTATQAGQFFAPVLYTGVAPSSQSITGVGFQPDFVWVKNRSGAYYHGLFDAVRGVNKVLVSNTTDAEDASLTQQLNSFNSNGFTVGTNSDGGNYTNVSGFAYVAWNWRASNATAVTNTTGSITSAVSANTTSGFSVVTYTGNTSANQTVGHGLGIAPSMIIAKCRTSNGTNWVVYHKSLGNNKLLIFTSQGLIDLAEYWGTSNPTSNVFGVKGGGYDNNTGNVVAYCFAPVAGYSAFGNYTGNLSTDGPFVFCGFRPRFVMIKRSDGTGNWQMYDTSLNPYNVTGNYLTANLANAEEYYLSLDILSNGFKLRNVDTGINGSGNTYIYACFAENPFKYSLAR